jgi:uncharacterized damage-inducible protein DinB
MQASRLARLFTLTARSAALNAEGLAHEDTLVSPAGGNCFNWALGHIVVARRGIFRLLSLEHPLRDDDPAWKPYDRGSARLAPEAALPLADLLRTLERTQRLLLAALAKLDEARLEAPLPPFVPEPARPMLGDTLGSALFALAWHEAYHAGQLGLLRRASGKPGAIA